MIEWLPSGKVALDSGAEKIPEVKKFIGNDRTAGKSYMNKALLYTYFMYRKGSRYESMFPKKRAAEICKTYFQNRDEWEKFEKNDAYRAFRDYYLKLQYTTKEQAAHSVLKEIEELITELQTIKFWVDGYADIEMEIDVPEYSGSTTTVKQKVKQKIKIKRDNKDEKLKAIKAIDILLAQESRLKESIREDEKIQKQEVSRSLMDMGELDDEE
ncbi:MAG: hypothetical protein JXR64_03005 [Spirochaetales bacterium]|nr:hypothetical protein [Spirochaetales bacterium]